MEMAFCTKSFFIAYLSGAFLTAVYNGEAAGVEKPPISTEVSDAKDLAALLSPIRAEYKLPALAAAVVVDGRVTTRAAVGVRKKGDETPVTVNDKFHIGSCGKAMTATLIATLVEDGQLKWDATLAGIFPEWKNEMDPAFRDATVEQLLNHRAGFPGESEPPGMSLLDVHRLPGTEPEQRLAYVRMIWKEKPEAKPGTKFIYSNAGFAAAGAVAEKVTGKSYADLMKERVFEPLGMDTAGYGAMGSPGKIDQPWQHTYSLWTSRPVEPGPLSDNPPAITPAGRIHLSVGDWAKFAAAHAAGETSGGLLKRETFRKLHIPPDGLDYCFGWSVTDRSWGGGRVLTHTGSNTMNYAVVWIAPKKKFAVVVATNQGGDKFFKACDDAAAACIRRFLKTGKP